METPMPSELKRAFLLSWPSLLSAELEEADLVFDHNVDLDSLEEFLLEQQRELSVEFNLNLAQYFPGWFSPFFHLKGGILSKYLKRLAKQRYPTLTVVKIWQSAIKVNS
jgi:hypothetical protein